MEVYWSQVIVTAARVVGGSVVLGTHSIRAVMYSDRLTLDTEYKWHDVSSVPLVMLKYYQSIPLYSSDSIKVVELCTSGPTEYACSRRSRALDRNRRFANFF